VLAQRRVRIALGRPCSCDRALAIIAGELDLGLLAGEKGGRQLGQGGKEAGGVKVRGVYSI